MLIRYNQKYRGLFISKLFSAILIIIVLMVLSLLDNSLINSVMTFVTTVFAGACYLLAYSLWKKRDEKRQQTRIDLNTQVLMTLVLIILSILLAYYAYWLLIYEPFIVMCRSGSCEFGPYGWSAALLSSGCAVLLLGKRPAKCI